MSDHTSAVPKPKLAVNLPFTQLIGGKPTTGYQVVMGGELFNTPVGILAYDSAGTLVPVSIANPLPTSGGGGGGSGVTIGPFVDHSGVTPDALSNTVVAANATRHYLMIQNISADTLWVNFGVAAVVGQPSLRINAGGVFTMESSFINNQAVNLIGAIGLSYVIKEG